MSLKDLRTRLLVDIQSTASDRAIPERLHKIYEHSIIDEVVEALRGEITQTRKFEQLVKRIPDINLVRKFVDKLARVYNKPASRKTKSGTKGDQGLLDYYSDIFNLNSKMSLANKLLELGRSCCLEPFMGKDGRPKLRVLANYQVRAYNGNPDDPLEITAITKLMGSIQIKDPLGEDGELKTVGLYHTYTASEFMVWHDDGEMSVVQHKIGRIPFIWINSSSFILNPYAPKSDIDSAVLVPKYYADLFYAMSYTAHSLLVGIDLTMPESAVYDAGAMLDLKTDVEAADAGVNKQGRLEVISPTIKIDEALALIKQAVNDMLESRGIKPPQSSNNSLERPNASAAIIESADASSHILQRCNFFYNIETEFWSLIKHMHNNYWLSMKNDIERKEKFSPDFKVDVLFGEVKPVEIRKETLENIQLQRSLGLMSRKQGLEELYPHFTDAQIDAWLQEAGDDAVEPQSSGLPSGEPTGSNRPGSDKKDPASDP